MVTDLLHLITLGNFEVRVAGTSRLKFESDKTRALMAYLAIESDHPHRRESLAGLLWPESTDKRARHSLSQAIYSLRSVLDPGGSLFNLTPQAVQFNLLEHAWLDVKAFHQQLQQVDAHCPGASWTCSACTEALETAVNLHQGEFLAGFSMNGCEAFEAWLCQQRELLKGSLVKTLERLILNVEEQKSLDSALHYALRLASIDEYNEQAQRNVMRLLAAAGRRIEALAHFQTLKSYLRNDLGIDPGDETVALFQRIAEEAERPALPVKGNQLPTALTPLLGREVELDLVCHKLAALDCRLLTLLGQGGIGKTRLALEAGHRLAPLFSDGVYLIDLDTQGTDNNLLIAIARGMGLEPRVVTDLSGNRFTVDLKVQLMDVLQAKNLLLLLDGFEGLLDQAESITELLRKAPSVKVLATSRVRLNLKSEQIILLEGLAYPKDENDGRDIYQFPAVTLFIETARRTAPELELSQSEGQALIEICRLNQGLPLGILLSAAWAWMLAPSRILQEIRNSFDFLSTGWRDLPERQRNLRATFDHSMRLLSPGLQRIFLRMAVFNAAFTAERARQVTGASLQQIKTLTEHSLLQAAGDGRLRLHDLLRQYAQEKLAVMLEEKQSNHERHCQVFMQALAAWEKRLKSQEQFAALAEMDRELADIHEAWHWAAAHFHFELLHSGARALERFYALRGRYQEGVNAFSFACLKMEQVGLSPAQLPGWANIAIRLANFLYLNRSYAQSLERIDRVEHSLHEASSPDPYLRFLLAEVKLVRSLLKGTYEARYSESFELSLQCLDDMRLYGDPWSISYALLAASLKQGIRFNKQKTEALVLEALAIQQSIGDPDLIAELKTSLLYLYTMGGKHNQSIRLAQELEGYLQRVNTNYSRATAATLFGISYAHAGEFHLSMPYFEQAISLFHPIENKPSYEFCTYVQGINCLFSGDYAAFQKRLTEYGTREDGTIKGPWKLLTGYQWIVNRSYSKAENELRGFIHFNQSQDRLDVLGHGYALLGYCAYRRGNLDEARQNLLLAIESGVNQGYFISLGVAFYTLALILAEAEDLQHATALLGLAKANTAQESVLLEDIFRKRITALTAALPEDQRQAALQHGQELDLYAAGAKYLEVLKTGSSLLECLAAAGRLYVDFELNTV